MCSLGFSVSISIPKQKVDVIAVERLLKVSCDENCGEQ